MLLSKIDFYYFILGQTEQIWVSLAITVPCGILLVGIITAISVYRFLKGMVVYSHVTF